MSEPIHHFGDRGQGQPGGQGGAADHHHRQSKLARGIDLGARALTAGILGDDDVNMVLAEQRDITFDPERSAINHNFSFRQAQSCCRRIDQAQEVVVLRRAGEGAQGLTTDSQEYSLRLRRQGQRCRCFVGNDGPAVARFRAPRRAFERCQWHANRGAGFDGVAAHLGGKGVSGVDHLGDHFGAQIGHKTLHPAKAAGPPGQGLRRRFSGATGIRIDGIHSRSGQCLRHQVGLGGAAQQKDACHA